MMNLSCLIFSVCLLLAATGALAFTAQEVKCHVCRALTQELLDAIAKEDPYKRMDVSSYRLDGDGKSTSKSVRRIKSEVFLSELVEEICSKKMDDYAKATKKSTGELTLVKMQIDGKMNSEIANVDFVQDGDLNKSLEFYCNQVTSEYDEDIIKALQAKKIDDNLEYKICTELAHYCEENAEVEKEKAAFEYKEQDEL